MGTNYRHRYPGVNFFKEKDQDIFFGRNIDIKKLYTKIFLSNTTVLHSKSGIGKSSLVRAGLLPFLKQENTKYTPIIIRFGNISNSQKSKKEDYLFNLTIQQLQSKIDPLSKNTILPFIKPDDNALWYLAKCIEKNNSKLLLIFDQFEEFGLFTSQQQDYLKIKLAELFEGRIPKAYFTAIDLEIDKINEDPDVTSKELQQFDKDIKFLQDPLQSRALFVVREDKLGVMSLLSDYFPNILKNDYFLKKLNNQQAKEAVIKPASIEDKSFGSHVFTYEEKAVEELLNRIDEKKTGSFDPLQIQIICRNIESKVYNTKLKIITKKKLPNINDVIAKFYIKKWKEVKANVSLKPNELDTIKEQFAKELVINGRRNSVNAELIYKIHKGKEIANILKEGGLITTNHVGENEHYSLSHDRLVRPVLKDLEDIKVKKKIEKDKSITKKVALFLTAVSFLAISFGIYERNRKSTRSKELQDEINILKKENDKINDRVNDSLITIIEEGNEISKMNNEFSAIAEKNLTNLNVDQTIVRYYKREADGNLIIDAFNKMDGVDFFLNIKSVKNDNQEKVNTIHYGHLVEKEKIAKLKEALKKSGIEIENEMPFKNKRGYEWKNSAIEIGYTSPRNPVEHTTKNNEDYNIRMYCYLPNEEMKQQIAQFLEKENYFFELYPDWEERPNFFSSEPTIFYYNSSTELKAKSLATQLNEKFNVEFVWQEGAGLGIKEEERETTFIIHYIE